MEENVQNTNSPSSANLKKFKVNKTVFLVIGLVILTAVLLAISLYSKGASPLPIITNQNKEEDFAHTSLVLSEEPRASSLSGVYEVDVNIDSQDNEITGTQLELSYDPKVLGKVDIKPGDFLSNPVVILKKIDTASGKISYMLGNQLGDPGVKGQGTVAVISFSKTGDDETFIDFLPQTLVTAQGVDQSVLKETVSAVIGNISTTPSGL